jgi:glucoside 3-dehydrogenase (cytochrome c) hitch-hiker subunit
MKRRELIKALALTTGAALSGSLGRAALAGASATDGIEKASLTRDQLDTISILSEMIIPTTDTPGAIAAGVPDFIHVIHAKWYRDDERTLFSKGLASLDSAAVDRHATTFSRCTTQQRSTLLAEAEKQSSDPGSIIGGFFSTMKELTVFGYYTSEIGSKQELVFNPVPMRYKGDYLFADVGRQWTP